MSRLVDADALIEKIKNERFSGWGNCCVEIDDAPTVCCETCKHGIKGERIGDREYVCCTKPHAELSNYHTKDWFCGDWRDKDAVD